ncbi:ATP-dependent helicase [Murdochiella vaginalis]|uniref:ATP-dependent helicase n=1 Tax=Murdochiella vaginalis TaxID=1852373 RepID=UPI0008FE2907|nr:ATP-dependent helicase [Murdochiella vaginalis]
MIFTPTQQQAIAHREGPCLVLAVPGAGKTTILLERLRQMEAAGIPVEAIASITFSRQQALDMKSRFKAQNGNEAAVFSTIHAFCYRILREYAAEKHQPLELLEASRSYNKYRIIDALYRQLFQQPMGEDEGNDFFRLDSYMKNTLTSAEEAKKKTAIRSSRFEMLQKAYQQFKVQHHLIDFDDMLWRTLQVLDQDETVRRRWQQKYRYYQVDEAQDTSLVQWRILHLLTAPENNIFIVADDDQSIYSFRGADPKYLLNVKTLFPHTKVLFMQENYRSTKNIVKLSAGLIRENSARYGKTAKSDTQSDEKTRVILTHSLRAQIDRLCRDLPADRAQGNVAVLYRNNLSALALMDALDRHHIAFQLRSDVSRYFHHAVIRDVFDFFNLSTDPCDVASFSRIYYKMNQFLKKSFLSALDTAPTGETVWRQLLAAEETQTSFYQERLMFLEDAFSRMQTATPKQALHILYQEIGYKEFLKERARRGTNAVSIEARLIEWLEDCASYCSSFPAFRERLYALEKRSQKDREERTAKELKKEGFGIDATHDPPVVLSTIHSAKGLEYDTVWLIDLIQTEFPSSLALEENAAGNPDLLEEERRLFYVGMTRAKRRLRLMGREAVWDRPVKHSQFIDELAGKARKVR